MKKILGCILALYLTGCSALTDIGLGAVKGAVGLDGGSKGGINTELVAGDKKVTVGNDQTVKAKKVDKVTGGDDSSINVKESTVDKVIGTQEGSVGVDGSVETVEVTNQNYPAWLVIALLIGNVVFLCMPTPTKVWRSIFPKKVRKRNVRSPVFRE